MTICQGMTGFHGIASKKVGVSGKSERSWKSWAWSLSDAADAVVFVSMGLGLELTVGNPSDEPQAEQLSIGEPAARDDASAGALSILTGGAR